MTNPTKRLGAVAATIVLSTLIGAGASAAQKGMSSSDPGYTGGSYDGTTIREVYSKPYYCDKTVPSEAPSGCEQGAHANVPPPGHYDPEYAIVPIGFTPADSMAMDCPQHEHCVAHPSTIDMTRVANDLAMVKHTTGPALLPSLGDTPLPGHNHYLTTTYDDKPQWWNVVVIGCTSPKTYREIEAHRSFAYIGKLLAAADPTLLQPTPTNLFLYFAVDQQLPKAM